MTGAALAASGITSTAASKRCTGRRSFATFFGLMIKQISYYSPVPSQSGCEEGDAEKNSSQESTPATMVRTQRYTRTSVTDFLIKPTP